MSEELVKRLRKLHDTIEEMEPFSIPQLAEAADAIEVQAAEIERLQEAGTKLAGFAGHDSECEDVTGAYPGSCSCGYSRAWKAWNAALGATE
jgi:hypothetical protein